MRSGVARFPILVLAGVLAAGAGSQGGQAPPQTSPQTPAFRSRIDLTRIDVTVIDNRTGRPVSDLTQADFTIREDGRTQPLAAFAQQILIGASATPPAAGASSPAASAGVLAPRTRREFLIVLGQAGRGGIARGPVKPYEGVVAFLRERLLPQDLVSVMAFNRATDLTADREYLVRVVERAKAARDDIFLDLMLSVPLRFGTMTDVSDAQQAKIDAIFQAPGSGEPAPRSATTMLIGTEEHRGLEAASDARRRPQLWNRTIIGSDLLKIYAGIEFLRRLDGQKQVVVLTGGMQMPMRIRNAPAGLFFQSLEDNERLAARAADAHVAINIIGTEGTFIQHNAGGGLTVSGGTPVGEIMSSQAVSVLSGGQYTSVRMADQQLARIDEASRLGYILGYVPANPALDGKYRRVEVKVNRPDVTVLYRHGYTATDSIAAIDFRAVVTSDRLNDAAATALESRDIQVSAAAQLVPRPFSPGQIRVEVTIDPTRLIWTDKDGQRTGRIDLLILCGDDRQTVVCSRREQVTLALTDAQYQAAVKAGIPYRATLPLVERPSVVKVIVYDYDADLLGTAVVKLG